MAQDTPSALTYATAAFAVGALLEYPLAKRFPLKDPVPVGTRMLVAGGLAFASTFVVFHLVSAFRSRPQLPK